MIKSIQRLNFLCKSCKKRADFEVVRTNDDLPEGYIKEGTRMEHFCKMHIPPDAKKAWANESMI